MAYMRAPQGATWRSGYAAVCKTVYTSSILVVASITSDRCESIPAIRRQIPLLRILRSQILLSRFRCPRFRLPGFAWLDFSHVQTAILVCARAIKNKKAASFVIS